MTNYDPTPHKERGHDDGDADDGIDTPPAMTEEDMSIDTSVLDGDDGGDGATLNDEWTGDTDPVEIRDDGTGRNADGWDLLFDSADEPTTVVARADDPAMPTMWTCVRCGREYSRAEPKSARLHFLQLHDDDGSAATERKEEELGPVSESDAGAESDLGDDELREIDQAMLTAGDDADNDADGDEPVTFTEKELVRKKDKSAKQLWNDADNQYNGSKDQSSATTKQDARDSVVAALETETDWISIRDRSALGDGVHLALKDDDGHWAADGAVKDVKDRMTARLGSKATNREVKHVVSTLASRNRVSEDDVNGGDDDQLLVPVANGTLDLSGSTYDHDTGDVDLDVTLIEDDADMMWMYRIDTEWDPDGADLDGLDEWVEEITHSDREQDRWVLWEWVGHSLHPEYPADGFMVLLGGGGSGKSQFLGLVKQTLGTDNVTNRSMSDLQSRFGKVNGALDSAANISTELSGTKLPDIGDIKALTAGEGTFVEVSKGVDGMDLQNSTTMLFASDDPPALPQQNRAVGRRLYPVEFPMSYVPDPDPENPRELQARPKAEVQAELQEDEARQKAALYRACEGLVRILKRGEPSTDKTWEDRIREYNSYADPIADFARMCLKSEPGAAVHTHDLQAAYNEFAAVMGHPGKQMSTISQQIERNTPLSMKRDRTRKWSDGDDRDVIYKDIAFTQQALESFVPESAHWKDGSYQSYVEQDPRGEVRDDDELVPVRSIGTRDAFEALRILTVGAGRVVTTGDAREAISRVVEHADEYLGALDDLDLVHVNSSAESVRVSDADVEFRDDDDEHRRSEAVTGYDDGDDDQEHTDDGDSDDAEQEKEPQVKRVGTIVETIEEIADGSDGANAPRAETIQVLGDRLGAGRDEIREQLNALTRDGMVYEPMDGVLKTTVEWPGLERHKDA